jgi:hypothetical protein
MYYIKSYSSIFASKLINIELCVELFVPLM